MEIFDKVKFTLHKWHSNVQDLETDNMDDELSFAKRQVGGHSTEGECKLLGLKWEKLLDVLQVLFLEFPAVLTKRGILAYLAEINDPLGLVSPMTLVQRRN